MPYMTTQTFIKKRPYLCWYVKDLSKLSDKSVLEHTLNYGTMSDVQSLIKLLGMNKSSKLFASLAKAKRQNLRPQTKNYLKLYFAQYDKRSK